MTKENLIEKLLEEPFIMLCSGIIGSVNSLDNQLNGKEDQPIDPALLLKPLVNRLWYSLSNADDKPATQSESYLKEQIFDMLLQDTHIQLNGCNHITNALIEKNRCERDAKANEEAEAAAKAKEEAEAAAKAKEEAEAAAKAKEEAEAAAKANQPPKKRVLPPPPGKQSVN